MRKNKSATAKPDNVLNGMTILGRYQDTVYIRLPVALRAPTKGCKCDYCAAHPNEVPTWDTLCVGIPSKTNPTLCGEYQHTWTVHMPDAGEFFKRASNLAERT